MTRPAATSTTSRASRSPASWLLTWTDDRRDPQYAVSRDALERLAAARDARGRRSQVVKLPMPGPLRYTADEARGVQVRDQSCAAAWPACGWPRAT